MAQANSTSSIIPSRRTYSCVRCYDRKVKCDRQHPTCKNCQRHNSECIFRPPPPSSRWARKHVKDNSTIESHEISETSPQEQNLQPPTPLSTTSENQGFFTKTQLVTVKDRSKFVNNTLWTRIVEEVHDPEEVLEDASSETDDSHAGDDDDYGFALGTTATTTKKHPHPTPQHMRLLWQTFVDNVDPLTKILHVPTVGKAVQKASENLQNIPKSFEALLFAVYSAAVMSLKPEDCVKVFGEPRELLLSRYTKATRAALTRAKFLGSVSLVVLQALALHLLAVRDMVEPRALWTMTGVAVRLAESMGLHLDGASLGLPPFETEIRRRIWWHLKMWDFRTAELCGLPKFRGSETLPNACKPPANVDDDQLIVGMVSPPLESGRLTDMIFVASRTEFFCHAMRQNAKLKEQPQVKSPIENDGSKFDIFNTFIAQIEEVMESKYLRYCDPSQPLELMSMHCARSILNLARFLAHHPRNWTNADAIPESERQYIWTLSIKLLEGYDTMQSTPQLQRFAWNIPYQWHVLIHVLDTLRATPLTLDSIKAWRLVESMYRNNPDMISNTKRAIFVAIGNLCLGAFAAYQTALAHGGSDIPPVPDFITQLRAQREAARFRRKARLEAKKRIKQVSNDHSSTNEEDTLYSSNAPFQIAGDGFEDHPHRLRSSSSLSNYEPYIPADTDQHNWFGNDFDHFLGTSAADIMNVDTDYMLAQDHSFEHALGQPIDWTQWDAWVGDMNVMPTNIGAGPSGAKAR